VLFGKSNLPSLAARLSFLVDELHYRVVEVFRIIWCPGFFWCASTGEGERELQAGTAKQNALANYLFGCVLMTVLGKPSVNNMRIIVRKYKYRCILCA
jgi:hypothetical protein